MKTIVLLAVALLLVGIFLYRNRHSWVSGNIVSKVTPCSDEITYMVYNQLRMTLRGYNSINVWIDAPSKDALDSEQQEINRIREWLKTVQLDPCVRGEYTQWLNYHYQNGLNSAYEEIRTNSEKQHMEEYKKQTRELFERVGELEKTSPIPRPPEK